MYQDREIRPRTSEHVAARKAVYIHKIGHMFIYSLANPSSSYVRDKDAPLSPVFQYIFKRTAYVTTKKT